MLLSSATFLRLINLYGGGRQHFRLPQKFSSDEAARGWEAGAAGE
jgi:hypothetical protein